MWYNHSSMVQLKPPPPVTIISVWIIPWYNYSIIDSIPSPTPFRQILNLHSPQTLFLQSAIISNRQSKSRQSKSQPAALGEQAAISKASKLREPSLVREHYIKVGNQKAGKPSGYSNKVPSFQRWKDRWRSTDMSVKPGCCLGTRLVVWETWLVHPAVVWKTWLWERLDWEWLYLGTACFLEWLNFEMVNHYPVNHWIVKRLNSWTQRINKLWTGIESVVCEAVNGIQETVVEDGPGTWLTVDMADWETVPQGQFKAVDWWEDKSSEK